jgi:hypothetical protein
MVRRSPISSPIIHNKKEKRYADNPKSAGSATRDRTHRLSSYNRTGLEKESLGRIIKYPLLIISVSFSSRALGNATGGASALSSELLLLLLLGKRRRG